MASIAIAGKSGTGKSTSMGQFLSIGIKGLNPKETTVLNVAGKDLPFKGWKKNYKGKISEGGNYYEGSSSVELAKVVNYINKSRPEIKNIVIDDAQYILAFEFMDRAKESGYNKFADMGVNFSKLAKAARDSRPDLKVYFLWHPENDREDGFKLKTIGSMIDNYLTLEGLFTVILYTNVEKKDGKIAYQFVTNNDGKYPAKSPLGMFEEVYIPNDLGLVSETIDKYNLGE